LGSTLCDVVSWGIIEIIMSSTIVPKSRKGLTMGRLSGTLPSESRLC
jgi:hypothetical protein